MALHKNGLLRKLKLRDKVGKNVKPICSTILESTSILFILYDYIWPTFYGVLTLFVKDKYFLLL